MDQQRNVKTYTAALIGDPDNSNLNAVMATLAQSVTALARVVSGDYLERESLSDRSKMFHIGCYSSDSLVDLINCPLTLRNLALALHQADRIAWVIRPDQVGDTLKRAISAAAFMGIRSHLLVVNKGPLPPDLKDEPELLEVMVVEAQDLFTSQGLEVDACYVTDVPELKDVGEPDQGLKDLAVHLLEKRVTPRTPVGVASGQALFSVEKSYAVSGPSGKPARAAFGPVRGAAVAVGQTLTLLMVGGSSEEVRISEVQQFGQDQASAVAGASVAIIFHSVPKDRPKAGDILTAQPERFQMTEDLSAHLSLLHGEFVAQALGSLSGLDACLGTTCVSCKVVGFSADDQDPGEGRVSLRSPMPLPLFIGQPILVGIGSELIGWGTIEGVSRDG